MATKNYTQQWLAALAKTHPNLPAPAPAPSATQQWQNALATTHPAVQTAPDAQYTAELGANAAPYQTALAQLPGNVAAAGHEYGYNTHLSDPNDPTSIVIDGVDPSNPYSRAALLQKTYTEGLKANTTNLAARGQHNSGAFLKTQQGQENLRARQADQNLSGFRGLITGYTNNLANIGAGRTQADTASFGGLTERKANDPTLGQVRTAPGAAPPSFYGPRSVAYKPAKKKAK